MTAPSENLSISVVVPVRNAAPMLPACLRALGELHPAPHEILLVDNGSSDESPELLRSFAAARNGSGVVVKVLEEDRRGASAARNRGLFASSGDVVAFTDADCRPARDWLARLREPFGDETVAAVAGRVEAETSSSTLELFSALYTLRLFDESSRHERWTPRRGGFPTANLAVRREIAVRLGGFDGEVVLYGEDYDFCARLYAGGGVLEYTPRAVVTHHHRERLAALLRQAFGFGRGQAYMMRRHGRRLLWIDLPLRSIRWSQSPIASWVDLSSADKKLSILVLAALAEPRFSWALVLYGGYLVLSAHQRARDADAPASLAVSAQLAMLLVLKSAAMTAGRFWGSLRYRTLCL